MGRHMGAPVTYNNSKGFCYWSGMFDWICALTADCLTCQKNKPKPKHRNEVPLKNGKTRLFFSRRFILTTKDLYTHQVTATFIASWFLIHWCYTQLQTLERKLLSLPLRTWIHFFEIPQLIVHDWGTALIIINFINWTNTWASLCDLKQHTRLGLMAKLKPRINTLPVFGGICWTTRETISLP